MDEPHSYEQQQQEPVAVTPVDPSRKNKTRFTCPGCGQNAWGKPSLAITCAPCAIPMVQS